MTITRRGLADEIDRLDDEIAELQKDKAGIFQAYRAQLDRDGVGKPENGDTKVTISSGGQSVETTSGALSKLAQTMKTPAGRAAVRRAAETTRDMERLAAEFERDPEGGEGGSPPPASNNPPPQSAPAPAAAQSSVTGAEPASGAGQGGGDRTAAAAARPAAPAPRPLQEWHTPQLIELDPATELPTFVLRGHKDCTVRATGPPAARPP